MTAARTVILDNEAVQALASTGHHHHRDVVAHLQVVAGRKRKAQPLDVVVPTAVRVEAGWHRSSTEWVLLNRLRIRDAVLDGPAADAAAQIRARDAVSVADAHVGATIGSAAGAGPVTVITSDPGDIRNVAQPHRVTIVGL